MTPSSPSILPPGPYVLTDRRLSGGRSHDHIVRPLLEAGIRLIQLREKYIVGTPEGDRIAEETDGRILPITQDAYRNSIRRCLRIAREFGATLIVNDVPELGAELDVHGVHVGQDDCPPRRAREILGPHRILGLSTHTRDQLLAALEEPIDYIAIGPVFGTTSKQSPYDALGLSFVRWAADAARKRNLPLVCIGGITTENVASLMQAAPQCHPAVIGAIMTEGNLAAAARRFMDAMKNPSNSNTSSP